MNTDDRLILFRARVRDALHAGWALERDANLTLKEREIVEHAVNRVHEADNAATQMRRLAKEERK